MIAKDCVVWVEDRVYWRAIMNPSLPLQIHEATELGIFWNLK